MAMDAYLQIGDIKGESTDDKHRGWIEVTHATWSVNQPRATSASTAGGLTVGRAELSTVAFQKLADISSPLLLQHCAMGKTIPKAKLEFMRADSNGNPVRYFEMELENVLVSGVTPSSGDSGILTEQVHLAFSKAKWKYTKQGIAGGAEGSTAGGWDCAANKCV